MGNKHFLQQFFAFFTSSAGTSCEKNLKQLWQENDAEKREKLQDQMQTIIDRTPKREFDIFDNDPDIKTSNPVLRFYDQALDKLVNEISASVVKSGTVLIWYLYNLGFVIKTQEICFGVDIHHRHAEKLAPLLDFTAVTHNHTDHYSLPLLRTMTQNKKIVVSNFFPNSGYTKAKQYSHTIKGITIHCGEADHNPILKNFTMPMEFICPAGDKNFVFFTSGDCCSHLFLNRKSEKIHLYAVHPKCGMSTISAAEKLEPEMTFICHLQELGHEIDKYRWQFTLGRHELGEFKKINKNAYVPVWGEKFLWDGKKIIPCQK